MTNEQALDVVEGEIVTSPHVGFAMTPAELKNQLDQLIAVQKEALTDGEDYGVIPGTKKPSLYKPGAEKVSYLYGLAPKTEVVDKVEDWERPFFRYVVRVVLIKKSTGQVVGDGVGECNSFEKRYLRKNCNHWPSKQDRGWPKDHSNKCYVRYTAEDADYTIANTVLKMARKRALVDAVLGCTMASHLFTQDTEDADRGTTAAATPEASSGANSEQTTTSEPPADSLPARKLKQIFAIAHELGKADDAFKAECYAKYDVKSMTELRIPQLNEIIAALKNEQGGEQQSA